MEPFRKAQYDEVPEIHVVQKSCRDCVLFPGRPITGEELKQLVTDMLESERYFECVNVTVARYLGRSAPDTCCYGFFYRYADRIPVLREAMREGKIHFLDGDGLPGLRETGLQLYEVNGRKWRID